MMKVNESWFSKGTMAPKFKKVFQSTPAKSKFTLKKPAKQHRVKVEVSRSHQHHSSLDCWATLTRQDQAVQLAIGKKSLRHGRKPSRFPPQESATKKKQSSWSLRSGQTWSQVCQVLKINLVVSCSAG